MRIVNLPFGRQEFEVEALGAFRVADKLAREGIEVCSFRMPAKNRAVFSVNGKDVKKVFAILRGSCYNIKKVRSRGFSVFAKKLFRSLGLVAGILFFLIGVLFSAGRVMKIEVVGSGAYYKDEVMRILSEFGIGGFSSFPEDCASVTARIIALPRVSFCTVGKNGGIVTVTVEVTDDDATLESEPLLSPCGGTVEELVVVRGTALVQAGDQVQAGGVIVSNETFAGEEARKVIVIARVAVSFPFAKVYGGGEENARLSAELEFGKIKEIHITDTGEGWLAEGIAIAESSLNLG